MLYCINGTSYAVVICCIKNLKTEDNDNNATAPRLKYHNYLSLSLSLQHITADV